MPTGKRTRPFDLLRWFAWLSPLLIAGIALANAWIISSFLNDQLFQREAGITRDFVQNILVADGSLEYLSRPTDQLLKERFRNTADHLSNMRDVLRANVFNGAGTIIWSSDQRLVGQRFADNDELEAAMSGELVVHAGQISASHREKTEHVGIDPSIHFFVESYIPVRRPASGEIVGVIELYKAPLALTQAIQAGRRQVLLTALGSALVLYLGLFWLIRRADAIIKQQHARLLDAETLAVVGELTSSVAHNLRNPLSSIRSSAELALESPGEDCSAEARDIIREVDRISDRVAELLAFSATHEPQPTPVDLRELLEACCADHRPAFERRAQHLSFRCEADAPVIKGDPPLLRQAIHSLLSNASEAMGEGGRCEVSVHPEGRKAFRIDIADTGSGLTPDAQAQIFRPFFTTKPKGLGLGLPLAKRIVERFGGTIRIGAAKHAGTLISITFPAR